MESDFKFRIIMSIVYFILLVIAYMLGYNDGVKNTLYVMEATRSFIPSLP